MVRNSLTDKHYWEQQLTGYEPVEVSGNEFSSILQKHLPVNSEFTCTEIGAYPGFYLCYLAKTFKYKPTAIEYRDDAEDIRTLFALNGIPDVEIINNDFLEIRGLHFDVVTSFGFIEHFIDYETVLKHHIEMVNPNGYLVLSVPHFWGLQGLLRRLILKKAALLEILETHNRRIMKLSILNKYLKRSGLELLFGEYVMGCNFWIPADSPKLKPEMKWLASLLARLNSEFLPKLPSCFLYSPMFLCIARKSEAHGNS